MDEEYMDKEYVEKEYVEKEYEEKEGVAKTLELIGMTIIALGVIGFIIAGMYTHNKILALCGSISSFIAGELLFGLSETIYNLKRIGDILFRMRMPIRDIQKALTEEKGGRNKA